LGLFRKKRSVLIASALATSEVERFGHHRSHR
jgi:hypothetical protein